MQIIPTIELQNGRCVTLRKGRLDEPMLWHVDPVGTVLRFVAEGADRVRVTDFDALAGAPESDALIEEIIRKAGVPVQVAGGIRSRERAEHWIEKGAAQVVVGTLAAQAPDMVKALAKYHPDMIVLSLDVWDGTLMTHGWGIDSLLTPEALLRDFEHVPLAAVIVTDVDAEVDEVDKQLGVVSALGLKTRHTVIASGLVDELDDIARLKYMPGIDGAIVGRALMRKAFTLREALDLARPEYEETAAFQ